jgi:hypothetical protein
MDAMVVNEDALHFEVCLFARGLFGILDECVLKTVVGAFIADDFARKDCAEAGED